MIYYAAYYGEKGVRTSNYAAEDKIDYICDAIVATGEKVQIISSASSVTGKRERRGKRQLAENKEVVYFTSLSGKNKLSRLMDLVIEKLQFLSYILTHIGKGDTLIVYHSMGYGNWLQFLHRIKKFRYILEVEELYQYIKANKSKYKSREDDIIRGADAYIVSNSSIGSRICHDEKKIVVVNGVYKMERDRGILKRQNAIVYAGTVEPQKGIDYVMEAAPFLPKEYQIHIAGFGNSFDVKRLKKRIEELNQKGGAEIFFDGAFRGEEYTKFLQSFKVGICIQRPDDEFNQYEFPSKVLSYMSNGLKVVCNELPQLKSSSIFPYLYIAQSTDPEAVARTIVHAFSAESQSAEMIMNELNEKFIREMRGLLNG